MMNLFKLPFDLNADLGEGMGNDSELIPFLSSSNIACGGHAGNGESMQETILLCEKFDVKIGAHPSYPDPANFGRKYLELSKVEFQESIISQIDELLTLCDKHNLKLNHIKPHGALYNRLAVDQKEAMWFVEIVNSNYRDKVLYIPPNSIIEKIANQAGINTAREAFADRSYTDDLGLVDRNHPSALLSEPAIVVDQIKNMVHNNKVHTITGKMLDIRFDTVCIHGDNPNATEIIKAIYTSFQS
ncbi:5-oxoprolinase subunit PxpA [Belliella sp. DSM 111904]|uniref:5-oxoprolinase subunit PxpA n=1 Tax=Belliella filtrata TaxID=2923435 RepID=A0ABS9V3B6_9BACT|nr:5-oxoprolinase subunit PxpA [Belliella filtrata]MCH7410886.1 5-oxoprolinase subunit PxpA [Belliella filtrata]